MRCDTLLVAVTSVAISSVSGSAVAGSLPGLRPSVQRDGTTLIHYDPSTGEIWVDISPGPEFTSLNIDSAASIFTGDPAENLGGPFDNDADNNIFKAMFGTSFGSLSFGTVAQSGLSCDFVVDDLTAVGSIDGGGDLGDVDIVCMPEPSSLLLALLGIIGLLHWRRRT